MVAARRLSAVGAEAALPASGIALGAGPAFAQAQTMLSTIRSWGVRIRH